MNRTILGAALVFLSLAAAAPTTKPTLAELRDKVIAAQQVVDVTRDEATKRMFESAEYKGLVADLAEKKKAFDDAKDGTPQQRLDASGPFRAAERALKQFKEDGWKHDPDYKKAVAEFERVNAPLAAAEREIIDKVDQARAAGEAERAKTVDADPIPRAIRKHQVIKGMTVVQADRAMKDIAPQVDRIVTDTSDGMKEIEWRAHLGRIPLRNLTATFGKDGLVTEVVDTNFEIKPGHEAHGSFAPPR